MKTLTIRPLIALFSVSSAMVLFLSGPSASAAVGLLAANTGHAPKTGCSQLTAAQVQAHEPVDRREQLEKRRGIHQVPVDIKTSARQFRPRCGVGVPLPPGI